MLKITKNKRLILILFKTILFGIVLYFFYKQTERIQWQEIAEVKINSVFFFSFSIILVFFNLSMEWFKWKNILRVLRINRRFKRDIRAFFSGILAGFLTPNMLGNFIGRIFYYSRNLRVSLVYFTSVSNVSQFMASIVFGLISIVLIGLNKDLMQVELQLWIKLILIFVGLLSCMLYFQLFQIGKFLFKKKSWMKQITGKQVPEKRFLLEQLLLSFFRHSIFSFQYYFLLLAFGIEIQIEVLFYIWQLFFISTLIPSLWMGKLFIRESVAIWILSPVTGHPEIILLSSLVLWALNQGLPALIGIPYIKISNRNVPA